MGTPASAKTKSPLTNDDITTAAKRQLAAKLDTELLGIWVHDGMTNSDGEFSQPMFDLYTSLVQDPDSVWTSDADVVNQFGRFITENNSSWTFIGRMRSFMNPNTSDAQEYRFHRHAVPVIVKGLDKSPTWLNIIDEWVNASEKADASVVLDKAKRFLRAHNLGIAPYDQDEFDEMFPSRSTQRDPEDVLNELETANAAADADTAANAADGQRTFE